MQSPTKDDDGEVRKNAKLLRNNENYLIIIILMQKKTTTTSQSVLGGKLMLNQDM